MSVRHASRAGRAGRRGQNAGIDVDHGVAKVSMPLLRFRSVARIALLAVSLVGGRAAHARDIPVVVAELAKAYVASVVVPVDADDLREQYAQGFWLGFLQAHALVTGNGRRPDVERRAFEAGQAYSRAHPQDRDKIFNGYGYVHVTVEGHWSTGFELNDFRPGGSADETWTLDAPDGLEHVVGGPLMRGGHDHVPVVVSGYVNSRQASQFYLGLHHRNMVVTAIWRASGLGLQDPAQLVQFPGSM